MGVADNKTYKDQYHFSDKSFRAKEEAPSINVDPNINSTIKENPYRTNVNIEGDEMVLQPDLEALFEAKGKKHSRGGINVYLKPNSFVYSDDPSMALTKEECDTFEFKKGGRYSDEAHNKRDYTPAKVIKKYVNAKDYNTLVSNTQDVKKDDLAKKSSYLMLGKHLQTLGQVAFLQEQKKGFPDGVPSFSMGTAPVYAPGVQNEIDEQQQYAKYGGSINNPYRAQQGAMIGFPNLYQPSNQPDWQYRPWGPPVAMPPAQPRVDFKVLPNVTVHGKVRKPKGPSGVPQGPSGVPPEDQPPADWWKPNMDVGDVPVEMKEPPSTTITTTFHPGPQVPDLSVNPTGVKTADWQFTPWQKLSQIYNLSKYAFAKRYMPYRSHENASYFDPSLVNPEQAVGDVKSLASQNISSLNSLSPILRNAQASQTYGQLLNTVPGIRAQYENENAQISNQARQYNNEVKNRETSTNLGFDQQYYTQSIVGRQNFDNLRSFLGDQYMNELLGDVSTNQSLAYNLLTQNNPAYGYDWRTGNFNRTKKSIMDVETSNPQADVVGSLLSQLLPRFETYPSRTQEAILRLAATKGLPLPNEYMQYPPPFKKKGGSFNPYRY